MKPKQMIGKNRGPINLGPNQIARSNLNLLEIMLERDRNSISAELSLRKLKASNYEDIVKYIFLKLKK